MRHFVLITLIILFSAGCALTSPEIPAPTSRADTTFEATEALTAEAALTEEQTTVEPEQTSESTPAAQNLLVALRTASARQIALLDTAGTVTPLLDIPSNASRVTACGDDASSPDGRNFAFYVGGTAGSLYLINAANTPVLVDDVEYHACLGSGTFQFSPDGRRFAYIDYGRNSSDDEYSDGTLRIFDAATISEAAHFENVTAFDLRDDGVIFVSLFTNNRGEADEAAVTLWDGAAERELVTLLPTGERCRFTSASVSAAADQSTAGLVLGQRCITGNPATQWQFYLIHLADRSATLAASEYQPGAFVPFARTNQVFFSPDSRYAFFTIPDGVTVSTVTLAAVQLADMTISPIIDRQMVMPGVIGMTSAAPRFSPDGQWLAAAVTSPNNDNQIAAVSLADPATPPIGISAGSRGDVISALEFTRDSRQIVYIAGATEGGDNTVLTLDLEMGSERRVARGHFDRALAISPDGGTAALIDWQRVENPRQPMYANLILLDLASSTVTTLFTGADVVDGEVTNLRSAEPLAWR